jgi:hypothetical protein
MLLVTIAPGSDAATAELDAIREHRPSGKLLNARGAA